jgi:hypothetical protein
MTKRDHLEDPGVDDKILSTMNANRVGFFCFRARTGKLA